MDTPGTRPVSPEDLAVTLAVRQELGPQADAAVIAEFLDRVGPAIDARVEQRLASAAAAGRSKESLVLALASVGVGIPITGAALGITGGGPSGVVSLLIAWGGLVGVNWAYGRS